MAVHSFDGFTPQFGQNCFIDQQAFVLGDTQLGDDCSVWPGAVIRGDMNHIRIGSRVSVQDGAVLHITHKSKHKPEGNALLIGDDVTIGHNACLHGCTLGSRVLVGIGAIVLDGAVVPDDVVLAAGCIVPPGKTLESRFLYIGSPVKKARELTEFELNYFTYSSNNYVALKDRYLEQGIDR